MLRAFFLSIILPKKLKIGQRLRAGKLPSMKLLFHQLQNNGIIDSGAHCGDDLYWACEINVGKDVTTDECYKLIVLNLLDNHK